MPDYRVTGPDGKTYNVTAPEGATQEQILSYAQSQAAPGQPGFLRRNVIDPVVGAVRGPEGLPNLPEFDDPAPGGALDTAKAAGGLMLAVEPEGQANIIREYYPDARVAPVTAPTGEQYDIVSRINPETNQVERGYVNAPGLSTRDLTQVVGQGLAYLPAGRAAKGLGLLGRMLSVGGKAAATSAAVDLGAEALGADQGGIAGVSPARAVLAGAAGGLFEGLSPVAARLWRRLLGQKKYFNASTGRLTEDGRKQAVAMNLDPDSMDPRLSRTFARYAAEEVDPGMIRRTIDADEFGIRQSRAQQTQDYRLGNLQDRMARGLEGREPQRIMEEFARGQGDDVTQAQARVTGRLSGLPADEGFNPAETVRTQVGAREQALKSQVNQAYDAAREAGPLFMPRTATRGLMERLRVALSDEAVNAELTPATVTAMGEVRRRLSYGGDVLNKFEIARRVVRKWYDAATTPADRRGVDIIKRELDGWLDDTIDRGLYVGDPQVVEALKTARGLRTQYGRLFERSGAGDRAGRMVEKIVAAETPEQAANYILGSAEIGRNPELTVALRRLGGVMGRESEGWGALKEMVWDRLSRSPQGPPLSADRYTARLNTALLRNKSALDELFSKSEIDMMKRYGRALDATQSKPTNPSQSAFALENALRYTLRRFGQRESFTKGNVGTGTMLNAMARMPINPLDASDIAQRVTAGRLLRPVQPPLPKAPAFVAGGVGATQQGAEARGLTR